MRALEERAASVVGKEVARGAAAKGATEKEAGTPKFCGEPVIRCIYIYNILLLIAYYTPNFKPCFRVLRPPVIPSPKPLLPQPRIHILDCGPSEWARLPVTTAIRNKYRGRSTSKLNFPVGPFLYPNSIPILRQAVVLQGLGASGRRFI